MRIFDFTIYMWGKSPDGKFYLSPFLDYLFFNENLFSESIEPTWSEVSGGLEVYIIIDQLRSYPICVTFGTNLTDVTSWFREEISFDEIEFEIILSLGMFY